MKRKLSKRFILILSSTVLLLATAITGIFAWYVDKGNFWVDSNNMTTYKEAYCNHIEGKNEPLSPSAYTTGATHTVSETMEPGDLIYYAFIMDYTASDSTSACTMSISLQMSYVFPSDDDSILANLCIEEDAVSVYPGTRSGTSAYTYTPGTKITTTSTEVDEFDTAVSFDLVIPALNLTSDSYLMIYVPVWYKDTNALQNNEKVSEVTFSKVVLDF